MNGKTVDTASGTRWGAVVFGWAVAVIAGILTSTVLRFLYGLLAEPPAAAVVVSLVAGFLSYLAGGYAAARTAHRSGGKHGALTAVFGLISGVILAGILAFFGVVFAGGVAVPPSSLGPVGAAWVAGLVLFSFNLFGGFVGGKLGEPSQT